MANVRDLSCAALQVRPGFLHSLTSESPVGQSLSVAIAGCGSTSFGSCVSTKEKNGRLSGRVLELAAKNFEANAAALGPELSTHLAQLRWGSTRDELEEAGVRPPYDAIIGADLVSPAKRDVMNRRLDGM